MDKDLQEDLKNKAYTTFKQHGMDAALDIFDIAYIVIGALADKETDRFKREDLRLTQINCVGMAQDFHRKHFKTETEVN